METHIMIKGTNLKPCFRNDDVSSDTKIEFFKKICDLFDQYNFGILQCITAMGPISNPTGENHLFAKGNDGIRRYCNRHIKENPEIIDFINSRPQDEIAAHSYHHICYSYASPDEQKRDLELCLSECQKLFPKKQINIFVPPFNNYNKNTIKICEQLGLIINANENSILLETIQENPSKNWLNKTLRFHYHKYISKIPLEKLEKQLEQINDLVNKG